MAAAKKASKRKAVAKKPAPTKQMRSAQARRPDVNDGVSIESIERFYNGLDVVRINLENYAAHMRALDRIRLNGVGVKKQGFIEVAYESAEVNPEFLPHWITIEKFDRDVQHLNALRKLFELSGQVNELVWNIFMNSADMAYTDALEYYAIVREAAKRRVDAAETIFNTMRPFFRAHGRRGESEPTETEVKRDVSALLHGRKDGEIIIKNKSPKIEKGEKKIIDSTYKTKTAFKNTEEGEII